MIIIDKNAKNRKSGNLPLMDGTVTFQDGTGGIRIRRPHALVSKVPKPTFDPARCQVPLPFRVWHWHLFVGKGETPDTNQIGRHY